MGKYVAQFKYGTTYEHIRHLDVIRFIPELPNRIPPRALILVRPEEFAEIHTLECLTNLKPITHFLVPVPTG